jgi:hypothetical protein
MVGRGREPPMSAPLDRKTKFFTIPVCINIKELFTVERTQDSGSL